jgi:hypothetical protein
MSNSDHSERNVDNTNLRLKSFDSQKAACFDILGKMFHLIIRKYSWESADHGLSNFDGMTNESPFTNDTEREIHLYFSRTYDHLCKYYGEKAAHAALEQLKQSKKAFLP